MAAAIFAASCDTPEINGRDGVEENPDAIFEVKATDVALGQAVITITHDGTSANTFYGFAYNDIETSAEVAVNREIARLSEEGTDFADVLMDGESYKYILKGLDSRQTYRYVAFGLRADGTVYGTPGTCEFTTERVEAEFRVTIGEVTTEYVTANIACTGYSDDTWLAFCTDDVTSDAASAIEAEVAKLGGNIASALKSGNAEVEFGSLEPETDYRIIVTGLLADGTVYGEPASATFATDALPFVENSAWTVAYGGRVVEDGEEQDVINVTATSGDRYVVGVYQASALSRFGIEAICEDAASSTKELVDEFVAGGYPLELVMSVFTHTASCVEPYNPLPDGEYIAVAVGIDDEFNLTRLYAVSEAFAVEAEPLSDGYAKWLGNWQMRGANDVVYNVSIAQRLAEQTYTMKGLQGFSDEVEGYYNAADGTFEIRTCDLDSDFEHPTYGNVDMWFVGVVENGGNQVLVSPAAGSWYVISTQTMSSDGNSATCKAGRVSLSSGAKDIVSMQFAGYLEDNRVLSFNGDKIQFPMTMTRAAAASGASAGLNSPASRQLNIRHRSSALHGSLKLHVGTYSAE
ncbi:MAG: hypothetical protein K2G18_04760 [Bacteroidales bacterium]|nr:hypothetical protein [Bacteroidales bacterium]